MLMRLWQNRAARLSAAALLALGAACALAGPVGAQWGMDPTHVDLENTLLPPWSAGHFLGTDELGRDVLLRLLLGGRISLAVGGTVAVLAGTWGTLWGVTAGCFGGWVETVLMRITDAMLAIPMLPLLMVLSALRSGAGEAAGLGALVLLLAALGWMTVARLARAATLQAMQQDHVVAATMLGASRLRVLGVHVLPHALPAVVVATALEVGSIILYEAALSFLGLGVQPPVPSWGNMLTHAQDVMYRAPWLALWPGVLILLTVACCNVLGDALRAALDPTQSSPAV